MLKLLGDKCICFCAGENPEFPLTIQRGVNLTILLKKSFAPLVLYSHFPQNFANCLEN